MGIADFFRERRNRRGSASVAKERLQIIVSHERAERGGPDYLPMLRQELLEVVRRYVTVDPDAVRVDVEREGPHEVLELNITLPDEGRDEQQPQR